jgi:hypothetical protein
LARAPDRIRNRPRPAGQVITVITIDD